MLNCDNPKSSKKYRWPLRHCLHKHHTFNAAIQDILILLVVVVLVGEGEGEVEEDCSVTMVTRTNSAITRTNSPTN